ncbi:MAG: beta-ketoacyl-ACP synthase [Planctomycetes bacterium]|nr:beta-ketoacyl-ACP synthase [Planctomycetota bacterium]
MPIPRVRPLPVTAYANLNALGGTRTDILHALAEGRSGLRPLVGEPGIETAVGAVDVALPELPSELGPWSTRLARMAAALVEQLDEPLRRARERWRPERIAVVLGTSTAGALTTEHAYQEYVAHGRLPSDYDFRRQHTFGAVLHVVSALSGARGPAWMISTACTSGSKPLASAQRLISAGLVDAALVGGFDTLCNLTLLGFAALQAIDRVPCRPFSIDRAGISIGEGGALALVERDGDARVLVEGVGETSDAYHISAPHPEGRGALDAMRQALEQAGRRPDEVDHINAHGTGTRLNDVAEAQAIRAVFAAPPPVTSTKGYTGHTLGAAGAIEFAFSAYAIEEGFLPPSIHADPVDPAIDLPLVRAVQRGTYRHVLSNSFAFGGNNVSVLVGAP